MMRMEIEFPGNRKISARFREFLVMTDQLVKYGGDNSAPQPFELFLASMGTCAGHYINVFCLERSIPTDQIKIIQEVEPGSQKGLLGKIKMEIQVGPDFPEKYKNSLIHASNLCAVKKNIENPPEFEIMVKTV